MAQSAALDVIISEVAWGGSAASASDEWIELYNPTGSAISLLGWTLVSSDLSPSINLTGTISAGGYYLLERDDDNTISDIVADQIYTGNLNNNPNGESLTLRDNSSIPNTIDTANSITTAWDGGSGAPNYLSMERIMPVVTDSVAAWTSNNGSIRNGLDAGIPSGCSPSGVPCTTNPQLINGTPHNSKIIDLSLTMAVDTTPQMIGNNLVFPIIVGNAGPDSATNVTVKNLLPAGLTYVSDNGFGTYDSGTGIWTVGTLASGAGAVLEVTANIATAGAKINYAEVWSADQFDLNSTPANNSTTEDDYDSVTVTPIATTGLSITNIVNNPTPNVGSNVVFTITVSNFSASNATGVQVNTTFPAGLVFVSSAPVTASGDLNIGNLNSGASVTFIVTENVSSSGTKNFQAVVSSNEFADATATATVNPIASTEADLSLLQTWARSTTAAGRVDLKITVTNNETVNSATNVQVRDLLPSGLTYFSHTGGTYSNSTGIWAVGTLLPGDHPTLTITATVSASGTSTTNFAEVWQSDQFDPDSTPGDGDQGDDDDTNYLNASVPGPEILVSDLSLTETVDYSGGNAVFTITVRNSGPDDASNITVKNSKLAIAANYTYISHSSTAGTTYIPTPGLLTSGDWTIPALLNGGSATLTVTTAIVAPAVNWAQVSDVIQVDPDSRPIAGPSGCDSNIASCTEDDDASAPSADLSLTQSVNFTNPNVGDEVVFTIIVSNAGVAGTTNVQVKDTLPSGLTFVSYTSSTGTYSSTTGIWAVGTMGNGASQTLSIKAKVAANGIKTNWAEVWKSDEADPDSAPGNGSITEDDDASGTITSYRSVLINEVAWSGTAASADDEWIELYNPSDASITITGWTLRSASGSPGSLNITLSGSISAGGYFLLERDNNFTVSDVVADQLYLGGTLNILSDNGEVLILCAPGASTATQCGGTTFIDTANSEGSSSATNPWPKGSLASNYGSMERQGTSAETDKSWATNIGNPKNGLNANNGSIYGTPKKANSTGANPTNPPVVVPTTVVLASRIVINEFLPRPGFDWNQDGNVDVFDEFIEVKNIGTASGTLGGFQLDDEANQGSNPYTLPSVTLKPGERAVFYGSQTNILLSDGGDTVRLLFNGRVYDSYTYVFAEFEDQSICRLVDGNGSWYENCLPTPNLTNTNEGTSPSMPDSEDFVSPVCELPDTLPADFLFAECGGYGAEIWHSYYWDQTGWYQEQNVPSNLSKWESFVQ